MHWKDFTIDNSLISNMTTELGSSLRHTVLKAEQNDFILEGMDINFTSVYMNRITFLQILLSVAKVQMLFLKAFWTRRQQAYYSITHDDEHS